MSKLAIACIFLALTVALCDAKTSTTKVVKKKKVTARPNNCPYDKFCLSCDVHICERCLHSYVDRNGICQKPAVLIPNCSFYSADDACEICEYNYYLVSYEECAEITVPNCAQLAPNSLTQCAVCNNGVMPDTAGQCTGVISCPVANCQLCGVAPAAACLQCMPGLMLTTDGTCVPMPQDNMNCSIGDDTDCEYCNEGYYNQKGNCIYSNVQNMPIGLASAARLGVAALTLLLVSRFA